MSGKAKHPCKGCGKRLASHRSQRFCGPSCHEDMRRTLKRARTGKAPSPAGGGSR
jgi:hypothetical protein